ncbi:ABC-F type ribosomal protection protein [Lentibacillus sp. N15]|uniref:ribosomal protection-like ABC-F family protein n=1 Tax=Lentibacillus songyuanensis TaxID=3136161 RepID=UPI0031BA7604
MFVLKAKGLRKEWNGQTLFENIDLEIRKGEHVALFGQNGSGKTTLLNGLLNRISFDSGDIQRMIPLDQWGVLEQDPIVDTSMTVMEYVQTADAKRYRLKLELERLQPQLINPTPDLMKQYNHVYNQFLAVDGYQLEPEAEKCLRDVKLAVSTWDGSFQQLSGGQKTRAQLARLMMQHPDFIIMDEPTNHLDQETMIWLENWLHHFTGAVLFVSHDRHFLDQTADQIFELNSEELKCYVGGYTDYRQQKALELRTQETLYRKQKKKREELLQTIARYQKWFHQAHRAAGQDDFFRSKAKKNVSRFKAKEKELERLEANQVQQPQADKPLNVNLEDSGFSAKRLLHIENMDFAYAEAGWLFSDLTTSIYKGDRLAVIGPNGSGKSTLLKLMVGKLQPTKGAVNYNPQTKIGYFAQELENLDLNKTILDSMLELPEMTQSEARTILGCFLFSRETVFKPINNLSMGEKCRVAFLHLYFSNANLLVLDEPTNFLDVDTKEIIEDVLVSYPGAIILVSHDRYLVKKVANRFIELGKGDMIDYHGEYDSFVEHKEMQGQDHLKQNDIRELELQLTRLMAMDTVDNEVDQGRVLETIKQLKQKLRELKQ